MQVRTLMVLFAGPLFASWAMGAVSPAPATDQRLDEVVVEARRTKLTELREAMVVLEDKFYERYNALNEVDDFDIHCARETSAGTRLERRHCRSVYESNIMAEDGSEFHREFMRCCDPAKPRGGGGTEPLQPQHPMRLQTPIIQLIEARQAEFRQTLKQVTQQDPQLVQLLRDRAELARQYEATRRKVFGRSSVADREPRRP